MKLKIFIAPLLILFFAPAFAAQKSTVDIVLEGKSCSEDPKKTIECSYRVGNDLLFTIAGVGQRDASITFEKSNADGDFYGSLGVLHGCVTVKRGNTGIDPQAVGGLGSMFDYAFISPKNGNVYLSWQDCKDGI